MERKNPCFNCHHFENDREIKSPCCQDTSLVVTEEEYLRLFLATYLANKIEVEEWWTGDEMLFYVHLKGACPHLTREGLCDIQDEKPRACRESLPGHFADCILEPDEK